jgi:uncharacterized protein
MIDMIILSAVQARSLLQAREDGKSSAQTSADLNLTQVRVELTPEGVQFPDGQTVRWPLLIDIEEDPRKAFLVESDGLKEIRAFSEETGWVRSLLPTRGAPTVLVSGIPMHRIKNVDPMEDTKAKMRATGAIHGRVLDTATGLGYTAIAAAKSADEVVTIELDPAALEVAKMNPWSRDLFDNPKIRQLMGDAFELVEEMEPGSFSVVIHDPPTSAFAGMLYSEEFYRRLLRVLSRRGRMFHYTGDPDSDLGRRTTEGVIKRLHAAGFPRVKRHPEAFGLMASVSGGR